MQSNLQSQKIARIAEASLGRLGTSVLARPIKKFLQANLERYFADYCVIQWSLADVYEVARDIPVPMSDEVAREVLKYFENKPHGEAGITWQALRYQLIERLFHAKFFEMGDDELELLTGTFLIARNLPGGIDGYEIMPDIDLSTVVLRARLLAITSIMTGGCTHHIYCITKDCASNIEELAMDWTETLAHLKEWDAKVIISISTEGETVAPENDLTRRIK